LNPVKLDISQVPSNRPDPLPYRLRELNSAQSAYQALRINQISNRLALPYYQLFGGTLSRVWTAVAFRPRKKDELNAMVFRPRSAFEAAPITVRDHLPLQTLAETPQFARVCYCQPRYWRTVTGCLLAFEDSARFELARPEPTAFPGQRTSPLCELSKEEGMGFEPMRPEPTDLANQRNKPLCEPSMPVLASGVPYLGACQDPYPRRDSNSQAEASGSEPGAFTISPLGHELRAAEEIRTPSKTLARSRANR
jgi:hypothetical protein